MHWIGYAILYNDTPNENLPTRAYVDPSHAGGAEQLST